MAHPYKSKAKTGEAVADARYGQKASKMSEGPVLAEARKNPKSGVEDEVFAGAPARQISNFGKVRK